MRDVLFLVVCVCVLGYGLVSLGDYLVSVFPIQPVDGLAVAACSRALHHEIPGSRLLSPETGSANGVHWVLGRTRVGGVTYGYYCELDSSRAVRYTEVIE